MQIERHILRRGILPALIERSRGGLVRFARGNGVRFGIRRGVCRGDGVRSGGGSAGRHVRRSAAAAGKNGKDEQQCEQSAGETSKTTHKLTSDFCRQISYVM